MGGWNHVQASQSPHLSRLDLGNPLLKLRNLKETHIWKIIKMKMEKMTSLTLKKESEACIPKQAYSTEQAMQRRRHFTAHRFVGRNLLATSTRENIISLPFRPPC